MDMVYRMSEAFAAEWIADLRKQRPDYKLASPFMGASKPLTVRHKCGAITQVEAKKLFLTDKSGEWAITCACERNAKALALCKDKKQLVALNQVELLTIMNAATPDVQAKLWMARFHALRPDYKVVSEFAGSRGRLVVKHECGEEADAVAKNWIKRVNGKWVKSCTCEFVRDSNVKAKKQQAVAERKQVRETEAAQRAEAKAELTAKRKQAVVDRKTEFMALVSAGGYRIKGPRKLGRLTDTYTFACTTCRSERTCKGTDFPSVNNGTVRAPACLTCQFDRKLAERFPEYKRVSDYGMTRRTGRVSLKHSCGHVHDHSPGTFLRGKFTCVCQQAPRRTTNAKALAKASTLTELIAAQLGEQFTVLDCSGWRGSVRVLHHFCQQEFVVGADYARRQSTDMPCPYCRKGLNGHYRVRKDGKRFSLQGTENRTLDALCTVAKINGRQVLHGQTDVPKIPYTYDGRDHTYHPDFYVPSLNLIVESKSIDSFGLRGRWFEADVFERNQAKARAVIRAGYAIAFFVWSGDVRIRLPRGWTRTTKATLIKALNL